jgi:hypothetical protein
MLEESYWPNRIGSTSVDHKVTALERAFQLAKSGRAANIDAIRKQLKQEGYDQRAVEAAPSLQAQLRRLIKAAHLARIMHERLASIA